jgi:hypothetical protein
MWGCCPYIQGRKAIKWIKLLNIPAFAVTTMPQMSESGQQTPDCHPFVVTVLLRKELH